ncbi:hypothetical protein K1719_011123 [Acacia pycnantha]|nr:hypothetical protein K1719_011123 [Acacia pycnantha]
MGSNVVWDMGSIFLEPQVGNQVHQDDPVNEAVRDAFGVQDDNFTERCGVRTVFFRTMQLGNFSASWMRAIVLCIKYTLFTKQSLLWPDSTDGCIPLRGFLGNLNLT